MTRKSPVPERVPGSHLFIRLKIHGRGSKPRLMSFFQQTCLTLNAAEARMSEMNKVIDALSGKGISENDLASYTMLFRNPEDALTKREQMIGKIQELGFGNCRAGKIADAIVTNASMAEVVPNPANLDILFAMVIAALENRISGQAVCKVVKENPGVIVPSCFAVSCIETTKGQGNNPDIDEDMLISKLSAAVAPFQRNGADLY